jgi:hypothetical protein
MDINFKRFNAVDKNFLRNTLTYGSKKIKIDLSPSIKPSLLSPVCYNGYQLIELHSKNQLIFKWKKRINTTLCLLAQFFIIIDR